jgi:AraC family transcriptional regulator
MRVFRRRDESVTSNDMQVATHTSAKLVLAGRNGTFDIGPSPGIKDLWTRFMEDFGQIAGQVGTKAYGICHNFDGKGMMDYLAAVEVENAGEVPGYMHVLTIPARKVAVFRHEGGVDGLSETWRRIFAEFLPEAKLQVASGPQFEVYDFSSDDGPGNIEIHIPVK